MSHIPAAPRLSKLKQVLCYDGYLTPENPTNQHHCIGASYHRADSEAIYREADQQENRQRLIRCLPDIDWPHEVDVSAGEARCGVRCATRDHLPMTGPLPDFDKTLEVYADLVQQKRKRRLRRCIGSLCAGGARFSRLVQWPTGGGDSGGGIVR